MSDDCANVWIILFSHYHKICFCTHHTSSGGHTWDIFSMGTLFLCLENFPQHNASFPSPSSRSHTFPFTNVFSLRSETCELDLQNSSTPALDVTWKKAIWGSTFLPELNLCQQWWWEKMNSLGGTAVGGRASGASAGTIKMSNGANWQHRQCLWHESDVAGTEGYSWLQRFGGWPSGPPEDSEICQISLSKIAFPLILVRVYSISCNYNI